MSSYSTCDAVVRLPPLSTILAFAMVVRLGSARRAAGELALTPSAVSHQIAKLEASLGAKLFSRSPRGLELTALGATYYQEISGALCSLAEATENLRSLVLR